jgi:hypothetical protein
VAICAKGGACMTDGGETCPPTSETRVWIFFFILSAQSCDSIFS